VDSVKVLIIVLSAIAVFSPVSVYGAACQKPEPLFIVERSKNRNTVHYDVCIGNNDNMSGIAPVTAYWIMQSGKKEELNKLEREYAYGIAKQEMLGRNRVRMNLVSMKERAITVEKVGGRYKAVTLIDGKESVLEKVYIKSHELIIGLPRVEFIELSGRTRAEDLPVNERIVNH
jgi:hypothetical protein